jgi:hypothetical protein
MLLTKLRLFILLYHDYLAHVNLLVHLVAFAMWIGAIVFFSCRYGSGGA